MSYLFAPPPPPPWVYRSIPGGQFGQMQYYNPKTGQTLPSGTSIETLTAFVADTTSQPIINNNNINLKNGTNFQTPYYNRETDSHPNNYNNNNFDESKYEQIEYNNSNKKASQRQRRRKGKQNTQENMWHEYSESEYTSNNNNNNYNNNNYNNNNYNNNNNNSSNNNNYNNNNYNNNNNNNYNNNNYNNNNYNTDTSETHHSSLTTPNIQEKTHSTFVSGSPQNVCVYIVAHGGYQIDNQNLMPVGPLLQSQNPELDFKLNASLNNNNNKNVNLIKYSPPGQFLYSSQMRTIIETLSNNCNLIHKSTTFFATNNGSIFSNDVDPQFTKIQSINDVLDMTLGFNTKPLGDVDFGVYILNGTNTPEKIFPLNYAMYVDIGEGDSSFTTTLRIMLDYIFIYINTKYPNIPNITISQLSCHAGDYTKSGVRGNTAEVNALSDDIANLKLSNRYTKIHKSDPSIPIVYYSDDESEVLRVINGCLKTFEVKYEIFNEEIKPLINKLVNSSFGVNFDIKNYANSNYRYVYGYFDFAQYKIEHLPKLKTTEVAFFAMISNTPESFLIETVCVAPHLRGRNYIFKLFNHIAKTIFVNNEKMEPQIKETDLFSLSASYIKDQGLDQQKRILIYERLGFHIPVNTVVKYTPNQNKMTYTPYVNPETVKSSVFNEIRFRIINVFYNGEKFQYTLQSTNDPNQIFTVSSSDFDSCYDINPDNTNKFIPQTGGCKMIATRKNIEDFTQNIVDKLFQPFEVLNQPDSGRNQDDNCGGGSCERRSSYLGGARPNLSTDVPKFERIVKRTKKTKRTKRTKRRISKKIHLRKSFNSKLRSSHAPKSKTSRRKIKH